MLLRLLTLLITVAVVLSFQPMISPKVRVDVRREMGLFDFQKFGGSGSASKDDLDDMWEAQQAILRERQGGHGTKESLKKKYKSPSSGGPKLGGGLPQESNMDKMRIDNKGSSGPKIKMPWDK